MERLTERAEVDKCSGIWVKEDFANKGLRTFFNGYDEGYSAINKCADYEDLEEQGLLLKLPCKVGDYIWDNDFGKPCSYEVTGFSFGNLNEDYCEDEVTVFNQVVVYYTNYNGSITGKFTVSEIGKTVFLTREEAEKAMRNK